MTKKSGKTFDYIMFNMLHYRRLMMPPQRQKKGLQEGASPALQSSLVLMSTPRHNKGGSNVFPILKLSQGK